VPYLSTISVFSHLVQIIILIPPFSRLRRYPFGITSVLKNLHHNPFGQQKKSLRQPVCIRRGINTAASCHLPQQIPYTQKRNLRAYRSQAQKRPSVPHKKPPFREICFLTKHPHRKSKTICISYRTVLFTQSHFCLNLLYTFTALQGEYSRSLAVCQASVINTGSISARDNPSTQPYLIHHPGHIYLSLPHIRLPNRSCLQIPIL